ncbi:MAG: hypothetical protein ACI39B_03415 [Methanobrevibacter smithii]
MSPGNLKFPLTLNNLEDGNSVIENYLKYQDPQQQEI